MSIMVKICGLTDVTEANYLNEYGADFAGMVLFFEKSKRNITIPKAREIMSALNPNIKKVAVTVSPTVEQAMEICKAGFDIIQIHGNMPAEVYDAITIDIWKAFNIKDMDEYETYCNMDKITGFVFDSASPGSGLAYDRAILSNINRTDNKLFILAGGLNPDNVADAISDIMPDVVDVSSGVEYDALRVGKDPLLIQKFINKSKSN